jgi:hypothetical protein
LSIAELLAWQWRGYPRYHRTRFNLLLHIVVVPLFPLSNLVVALARGAWLVAGLALVVMLASVGLQGLGHAREPVPPEPFTGPRDALTRLFCEQWITFPRFVIWGGWWHAWRTAAART